MNLLSDPFISTTQGKVSLKEVLTSSQDYQLQYYFDETQLAMLQLLASLTTVVLKPTIAELKQYLTKGVSTEEYDKYLAKVDTQWFEDNCFMQSKALSQSKVFSAPVCNLISGIESSGTVNASGLFSEMKQVENVCSDCIHALNYNLHMNIKGDCFGSSGATGIRGGGAITTLIAGRNLKATILANTVAVDNFNKFASLAADAEQSLMWEIPPDGDYFAAHKIGLERGLFALAYHISFKVDEKKCSCDVCGHLSTNVVTAFQRTKYTGSYGSTKKGRDAGAGFWLHPYTPRSIKEDGTYAVCARDQHWQSWQELTSYVIGKETNKSSVKPAYIVNQYQEMGLTDLTSLLIGGNIANQASIVGRVYDLYSMPSTLSKNLTRITKVVDAGLIEKEKLSIAFNKLFGIGYDKNFVGGIKEQAMHRFIANAQQIIQQILLDVDNKDARQLRRDAVVSLNKEAKQIFASVQRKYQHDLPLFKALVKGEFVLHKPD
jgi:CRISPR system Cascade subunit CasA